MIHFKKATHCNYTEYQSLQDKMIVCFKMRSYLWLLHAEGLYNVALYIIKYLYTSQTQMQMLGC